MKKIISLILCIMVLAVSLTGCGSSSIAGTYSFRMGKVESQHMGIYMNMTDEDVKVEEVVKGKKFILTMDLSSMIDLTETTEAVQELASKVQQASIEGYYTKGETIETLGTVINLNIELKDTIKNLFPEVSQEVLDTIPDLPASFVQMIIYCYIDDITINLVMPVSYQDLKFQLYWYGYDIDNLTELPEEQHHKIATHPTEEDVNYINNDLKYPENHKDSEGEAITYRDYHTLKLGLTKEL